jgi:predicted anti-sigma-YlaC factor YlaD
MTPCEALLDRLDAALAGTLPAELAAHVDSCSDCRMAVERARGLAEGERLLRSVRAPESLKARLKGVVRLAPACEHALDLLTSALDGEIDDDARGALLAHLHACPSCQGAWEAFATLHEVGAETRVAPRLRAALALPPSQHIAVRRKPSRFFDLRLATAAAYLLAALTVVLLSNPATVARASSEGMDRAALYARAAVENRVSSYSQRIKESVVATGGWVHDRAVDVWDAARSLVGAKRQNPDGHGRVLEGGKGGRK